MERFLENWQRDTVLREEDRYNRISSRQKKKKSFPVPFERLGVAGKTVFFLLCVVFAVLSTHARNIKCLP